MLNPQTIEHAFTQTFGAPPTRIARAPGRVNLIGEHTDYNAGFVLPMAIDRAVWIAARARADRTVQMVARDFADARSEFSLEGEIAHDPANAWSDYVRAVAWALRARGYDLPGLELVIQGDVPLASGLSSSAALEVCVAVIFNAFGNLGLDGVTIARACQQAENEFIGVKSGIMDQFISALACQDHALLIDCRDLTYRAVALPRGATFVVCDTLKRRGLVSSEYNARRNDCEQAAQKLGVTALREITLEEFTRRANSLPAQIAQRARHVVTENARVLAVVAAAERGDLGLFGTLMNASHDSLRDDYAVSCAELDLMVACARAQAGCFGARLTGAGFGGCAVCLVADENVDAFTEHVAREYSAQTGIQPPIYVCHATAGAGIVT